MEAISMNVYPENILRCMRPEDRKALGIGGMTVAEATASGAARSEKELQRQLVQLLRLKGIEPMVPVFGKKTRMTVGWPDITFAVNQPFGACAWEVKIGNGKLSTEQTQMAVRLMSPPNGWRHAVIRSVDEALAILRELGVE